MSARRSNKGLQKAKNSKKDEFYTQYEDIANEMGHYAGYFADKIIYLNCDKPGLSNFWKYFADNFNNLKIKELRATYYSESNQSYYVKLTHTLTHLEHLTGNGDFSETTRILRLL